MPNYQTTRFRFVEVAPQIYAAISPAQDMDITDAGLMDNFSNAGIILHGEGLVCDTCFDVPHAEELLEFCKKQTGRGPKYVVNTHGHWDHFWGNQVFGGASLMGHVDILKDCTASGKKAVPLFKVIYRFKGLRKILSKVMAGQFKGYLSEGKPFQMVIELTEKDFDLTGVVPTPPTVLFEGKTTLELGGCKVELIPLGAVHSASDTVVWLPEEKVLFAGDIFADCSLPASLSAARRWLKVLDYILDELCPVAIIPGHGEVYDQARAQSQRDYFRALVKQFEANYTDTITQEELLGKMDLTQYIDHRPRFAWIMSVKNMFSEARKKKQDSARSE